MANAKEKDRAGRELEVQERREMAVLGQVSGNGLSEKAH